MKNLFSIEALATFLFTSCTKVIELDLNSSDPQTVIEGRIGTTGDSTLLNITKFVNLFDGPQNASAPDNPYTNFIGSKLGSFSEHTTQKITMVFCNPS